MKRRTLLRACGAGIAFGIAGCGSPAADLAADEIDDDEPSGEQTTRKSTTEESTTETSTTEESTTETSTTEESTTEESTTETPRSGESTTETPRSGEPTTEQPTTEGPPRLVSTSVSTENTGCRSGQTATTVSFEDGRGAVVIDGAISASNPCHRATLSGDSYDSGSDTLELTVGLEQPKTEQMCVQCVGSIEYTAEATFDGGLPGSVRVVHDGLERRTAAEATSGE